MIIDKKINDLTRFPIIFIIFALKNKKKYAYVLLLIKKQNTPKTTDRVCSFWGIHTNSYRI